jgi:hypothetical protein
VAIFIPPAVFDKVKIILHRPMTANPTKQLPGGYFFGRNATCEISYITKSFSPPLNDHTLHTE